MDLKEIEYVGVEWVYQAQYRDQGVSLVNTLMKLRVP
jgi:hypothetical protein